MCVIESVKIRVCFAMVCFGLGGALNCGLFDWLISFVCGLGLMQWMGNSIRRGKADE